MLIDPARVRLGDERGFTLIELCVAMAGGIVVMIGLLSIMIATLHQTQRTFTKVDATRQARTALATIENELNSACVGAATPIQAGSDANDVEFLSFYGTSAAPRPVWHELSFDAGNHTLTDADYNVTGSGPAWGKGTLASKTTLLSNVSQQSTGTDVFQYFAYQPAYTDAKKNAYWTIPDGSNRVPVTGAVLPPNPLPDSPGLSSANAGTVVEVLVNLLVGATSEDLNGPSLPAVNDPVTDGISLRLTTPPVEVPSGAAPQGYGPCQ
jgi:Tfp pilus assembly protein PilV